MTNTERIVRCEYAKQFIFRAPRIVFISTVCRKSEYATVRQGCVLYFAGRSAAPPDDFGLVFLNQRKQRVHLSVSATKVGRSATQSRERGPHMPGAPPRQHWQAGTRELCSMPGVSERRVLGVADQRLLHLALQPVKALGGGLVALRAVGCTSASRASAAVPSRRGGKGGMRRPGCLDGEAAAASPRDALL